MFIYEIYFTLSVISRWILKLYIKQVKTVCDGPSLMDRRE